MAGEISSVEVEYNEFVNRKWLFSISCLILLLVTFVVSISVGPSDLAFSDVLAGLFGRSDGVAGGIVWNIRMPQAIAAIVGGAGLALAGAAMQNILRNPLGSPFTLGISQAAAFGAAFAIVILGAGGGSDQLLVLEGIPTVALSAFIWTLAATGAILLLVKYAKASPETLILAGIAIGSLLSAALSLLQYAAVDTDVAAIVYWTFGDVARASWTNVGIMTGVTILGGIYFIYNSWNYTAMNAGDEAAKGLGVNVERLRIVGMVVAALVTAGIIAFVGIIGFVGLVVPHIVRKLIGSDERFLLPASALAGGVLLLASDTVARTILAPIVLPVGILTAFLGAPIFLYLVIIGRDYW